MPQPPWAGTDAATGADDVLIAAARTFTSDCIAETGADPAALRFLGTAPTAAEDVEALRRLLAQEQRPCSGQGTAARCSSSTPRSTPSPSRPCSWTAPWTPARTAWMRGWSPRGRTRTRSRPPCSTAPPRPPCARDVRGGDAGAAYDALASPRPVRSTVNVPGADGKDADTTFTLSDLGAVAAAAATTVLDAAPARHRRRLAGPLWVAAGALEGGGGRGGRVSVRGGSVRDPLRGPGAAGGEWRPGCRVAAHRPGERHGRRAAGPGPGPRTCRVPRGRPARTPTRPRPPWRSRRSRSCDGCHAGPRHAVGRRGARRAARGTAACPHDPHGRRAASHVRSRPPVPGPCRHLVSRRRAGAAHAWVVHGRGRRRVSAVGTAARNKVNGTPRQADQRRPGDHRLRRPAGVGRPWRSCASVSPGGGWIVFTAGTGQTDLELRGCAFTDGVPLTGTGSIAGSGALALDLGRRRRWRHGQLPPLRPWRGHLQRAARRPGNPTWPARHGHVVSGAPRAATRPSRPRP